MTSLVSNLETAARTHLDRPVLVLDETVHVWLLESLPKGPTGKVLEREIARPAELA
jgi:hypothetical protein